MKTVIREILIAVFFCSFISSCGSAGGGDTASGPSPDSMTLSIDNGPVTSFIEAPSTTAPPAIGKDPYVWSSFDSVNNKITLYTYAGYNGSVNTTTLEIDISGITAGTYPVTGTGAVFYTAADGNIYFASPFFPGSNGAITVSRYDTAAGGKVQGTFDVTAVVRILLHERTARLTGGFDVTRD